MLGSVRSAIKELQAFRKALKFELFDAEFYSKSARSLGLSSDNPWTLWEHYVNHGGFAGLDPSEFFDSDWYLHRYPDVLHAKINPLVHYVCYGAQEGRLPYHGAGFQRFDCDPVRSDVERLRALLWAGYEHLAVPALERLDGDSLSAAQQLAAWDYYQGNFKASSRRLLSALSAKNAPSASLLVGIAKCAVESGADQDLRAAIQALGGLAAVDTMSQRFIAANLAVTDEARLAIINELFRDAGVAELTLSAVSDQLTLSSIGSGNLPFCFLRRILVSVVVPAYNAEETLDWSVRSLLAQSWRDIEVVIVDDCSVDDTPAVAQALCNEDRRVQYIRNARNLGAYGSRNVGMAAASGDFVTVQDSDDWSHPQKIERQMAPLLNDRSLIATGSSWVRVTRDLRFVGSWILGDPFLEKNHSSWLFRRSVLETVGLWDEVKVAADTEFLWRVEHHFGHHAMRTVDDGVPLSFSLADESSLTRTKATHVKTVFFGLRRLYREASSWWHRASYRKPYLQTNRPFPVPLGILKNPDLNYDVLFAADLSRTEREQAELLEGLDELAGRGVKLCLLHWPDRRRWHGNPVADAVFAWAHKNSVNFAHSGLELSAREVVLADPTLWEVPTTETVKVNGLECIVDLQGAPCRGLDGLMTYFTLGKLPPSHTEP